jgi:hypothetical protein
MFRVQNAIVCDIVRAELANKFACLGIYPKGLIVISDFSLPMLVSFFLDIASEHHTEADAHFILENRQTNEVFSSFQAKVALEGWTSTPLYTPPMEIRASGPATIHFSAIVGSQKIELAAATLIKSITNG